MSPTTVSRGTSRGRVGVVRLADKLRVTAPSGRTFTVPATITTHSSVNPKIILLGDVMACPACRGEAFFADTDCPNCSVGCVVKPTPSIRPKAPAVTIPVAPLANIAMPPATKL